jgi:hypothetical protein
MHGLSLFAGLAFACLALQLPSCGSNSSSTQDPGDPGGSSGAADGSVEASSGGSSGAKGGSGGAAGDAGAKGGNGGAAGTAGKAGHAGADSGVGGGDASAGSGGKDGGGTDSSTGDTGLLDAPKDAVVEADAAPAVCTLQTGEAGCQTCMIANCNDACLKCEANPFCQAIIACVDTCGPNDDTCRKKCWDNNKDGQDDFTALASQSGCLNDHCATECPNLPDTSGCSMAPRGRVRTDWLLLAAMLGIAGAIARKRTL